MRRQGRPHSWHHAEMNWYDAAEDLVQSVLAQTPRPGREAMEGHLREAAERLAEEDGKRRVGVETIIAAWVAGTPGAFRGDLPRQMERYSGLDLPYARLMHSRRAASPATAPGSPDFSSKTANRATH